MTTSDTSTRSFLNAIWATLDGDPALAESVRFTGQDSLRSACAVSNLAVGSIGAAALSAAEYAGSPPDAVTVDRRLALFWFGWSFRAEGWNPPPDRNPVSGDYLAAAGWIRLHISAPHHLTAALAVLGVPPKREAVAAAVRERDADALEAAVVAAGGAAVAMRTPDAWTSIPRGRPWQPSRRSGASARRPARPPPPRIRRAPWSGCGCWT